MTRSPERLSPVGPTSNSNHSSDQSDYSQLGRSPKGRPPAPPDAAASTATCVGALSAYGIAFHGLAGAHRLLRPSAADDLPMRVAVRHSDAQVEQNILSDSVAHYRLKTGGSVLIHRDTANAEYRFPASRTLPSAEEMTHPYLFAAAATMNYWRDRHTFHAGAFVHAGGAWCVAGAKGAGKSSMLGWLAAHGFDILTDDLVVVDDGAVLAGPACVDLRGDASRALGIGEYIGIVGARERWRYTVRATPARVPLRGWIFPEWGDDVRVSPLPIAERLRRLLANPAIFVPPRVPDAMIELAATSCYRFSRPRDWSRTTTAIDQLLTTIAR